LNNPISCVTPQKRYLFPDKTCVGGPGLSADGPDFGGGILLLVAGKPWLLIISLLAYIVAFGKIGCQTH
jgi:hypothetical protein